MAEGKKKKSQGDECSFLGCSNRMYDATGKKHALDVLHFQRMKSLAEFEKTALRRESGGKTVSL